MHSKAVSQTNSMYHELLHDKVYKILEETKPKNNEKGVKDGG